MVSANVGPCFENAAQTLVNFYKKTQVTVERDQRLEVKAQLVNRAREIQDVSRLLTSVAGEIGQELAATGKLIEERAAQVEALAEQMDEPFSLFVVGMGKVGKSTLINALAETKVADVDILPKTWKIDVFHPSMSEQVIVRYRNGATQSMSEKQVRVLLDSEEAKIEDSLDRVEAEFRKRSKGMPVEELKLLKLELKQAFGYVSPVSEVVWPCKANGLLHAFRLVDTPGLFQVHSGERDSREDIRDYYHKADGVLWLLDAQATSGQGAREAIEELVLAETLLDGLNNNMLGVLNRIDRVQAADVNRVVGDVKARYGERFREIVPISAQLAWEGLKTGHKELFDASGLSGLIASVEFHFQRQAGTIQQASKLNALKAASIALARELQQAEDAIMGDLRKYEEVSEHANSILMELEKTMLTRIDIAVAEYRRKVETNIRQHGEAAFDAGSELERRLFAETTIFDTGSFQNSLQVLMGQLRDDLQREAQHLAKEVRFQQYQNIAPEELSRSYAVLGQLGDIENTYFVLHDGVLSTGLGVLAAAAFGPIGLLAAGVGHWMGITKVIKKTLGLSTFIEKLEKQLGTICQRVTVDAKGVVSSMVQGTGRYLFEVRDLSFADLYLPHHRAKKVLDVLVASREQALIELSLPSPGEILKRRLRDESKQRH